MENKYKISIIIPVYNVELYIRSCLNSVFQQTLSKDIECILVDDCGKDKSVQIVTEMLSNYHGSISFKFFCLTLSLCAVVYIFCIKSQFLKIGYK